MVDPTRHNWPKIIREIKRGYQRRYRVRLTNHKLGMMVAGTDSRTVAGWIGGTEPGHYKGNVLLAYHREFHSVKLEVSTTSTNKALAN